LPPVHVHAANGARGKTRFRFGAAIQRTKVYQTDFDIQRGVLVGFTYKKVDLSALVFNPDAEKPAYVLSVSVNF
jgi:hypothetical protein